MLAFLDTVYTLAHLHLIGFNLFGWVWRRTRKAHLISLILTAASWFVLGAWYGWGYCPLTDWHWEVKEKLGERNLPASFIKYFADKLSGTDIPSRTVDVVTLVGLMAAIAASVFVNFFQLKRTKQ
ncbi:MAG: DUF2784 domain-containing protein [Chitinophagaceae bacterium]|nr:DUF2784 domain-containing protein [Chitinophagaceae bacterium]